MPRKTNGPTVTTGNGDKLSVIPTTSLKWKDYKKFRRLVEHAEEDGIDDMEATESVLTMLMPDLKKSHLEAMTVAQVNALIVEVFKATVGATEESSQDSGEVEGKS